MLFTFLNCFQSFHIYSFTVLLVTVTIDIFWQCLIRFTFFRTVLRIPFAMICLWLLPGQFILSLIYIWSHFSNVNYDLNWTLLFFSVLVAMTFKGFFAIYLFRSSSWYQLREINKFLYFIFSYSLFLSAFKNVFRLNTAWVSFEVNFIIHIDFFFLSCFFVINIFLNWFWINFIIYSTNFDVIKSEPFAVCGMVLYF